MQTRGFHTAPRWFSGGTPPPDAEGPDVIAARKRSRDSYADSKEGGPEPVDAGKVGNMQAGVNVLGGTPIKPQSERMTQDSQLHRCGTVECAINRAMCRSLEGLCMLTEQHICSISPCATYSLQRLILHDGRVMRLLYNKTWEKRAAQGLV